MRKITISNTLTLKKLSALSLCLILSTTSFFASNVSDTDPNEADLRMKIRLEFNSTNTYTRQINIVADENASSGYDQEFDMAMDNLQADDMYWLIDAGKFVNQGINDMNEDTVLPIGVNTSTSGVNVISINKLENIPSSFKIFIHDTDLGVYHSLKEGDYAVNLTAGVYLNRFEIVFSEPDTLSLNEFQTAEQSMDVLFNRSDDQIKVLNHSNLKIESIEVYSLLGQAVYKSVTSSTQNEVAINASQITSGTYVVIVRSDNGIKSKKILVN
ncbi:MAG: T9SS type A sorting domain-containing protein [Algicola sp.]|nr:T9SS type A sorting domain-containing protein [Algicola sp.]